MSNLIPTIDEDEAKHAASEFWTTPAIQLGLDKIDNIDVVENNLENFERSEEATETRRERLSKVKWKGEDHK